MVETEAGEWAPGLFRAFEDPIGTRMRVNCLGKGVLLETVWDCTGQATIKLRE